MERISELLKNFGDYISHYIVCSCGSSDYSISYSYMVYDLVDRDLDFNEAYYAEMMKRLRKLVVEETKQILKMNGEIKRVKIEISKMTLRNVTKMEHTYMVYPNLTEKLSYY